MKRTERPAPFFQKSLQSEKTISLSEAERAIYIDFEGFEKEPPALVGVLIEDIFEQIILDERFQGAATYKKPMKCVPGQAFICDLLANSYFFNTVKNSLLRRVPCIGVT